MNLLQPPSSATNSEEAEKMFSKEPTDRGELWVQHALWYLADCPRAKRQYLSDIDALVETILTLKNTMLIQIHEIFHHKILFNDCHMLDIIFGKIWPMIYQSYWVVDWVKYVYC